MLWPRSGGAVDMTIGSAATAASGLLRLLFE